MNHFEQLEAAAKEVEQAPQRTIEKLARAIVQELHETTPVRTGAAASSWGATIGGEEVTHPEIFVPEGSLKITPPQINVVSELAVARITNPKDYLFDINYLGTSQKAPVFFVQMAVERVKARILE